MKLDELAKVLEAHKLWLGDGIKGKRANLSGADLSGADLSGADLSGANLTWADLSGANLTWANLTWANLSGANLTWANLTWANLYGADLSGADLSGANLSEANLSEANLSGADGFFDGLTWASNAFESTADGVVVYKVQSSNPMYSPPKDWKYTPGEVLTAIVNPLPTVACACGVNAATREWCKENYRHQNSCKLWKCLIRWPWLIETVVPYNTDGKIRCSRVELLEVVEEW